MIPITLRIKNIGPFKDESLDFSKINGDVIAILGRNGSGKTMLLESMFAGLYRVLPSRGPIYDYCTERDALIEFAFKLPSGDFLSRVVIDAKKRSMEPWLFDGDGKAMNEGEARVFDELVEGLLGPKELVLASSFITQEKRGSFLKLGKAERKDLFIALLGLERLQTISVLSSDHSKYVQKKIEECLATIEGVRQSIPQDIPDIGELERSLNDSVRSVTECENEIEQLIAEIESTKAQQTETIAAEKKLMKLEERLPDIEKRMSAAKKKIDAATETAAKLKQAEERIGKLEADVAELRKLRIKQSSLTAELADFHNRANRITAELREAEKAESDARYKLREIEARCAHAEQYAKTLDTVPCHGEGEFASCHFIAQAISASQSLDALMAERDELRAAHLAASSNLKEIKPPDFMIAKNIGAQIDSIKPEIDKLQKSEALLVKITSERAKLQQIIDQGAAAQSNYDMLRVQYEELRGEADSLRATVAKSREVIIHLEGLTIKLEKMKELKIRAQQRVEQISASIQRALEMTRQRDELMARIADLEKQVASLENERKSWGLLSTAFGRTGIQSLEIDAAGPGVSQICNDLMLKCFGPRFSVSFVTQVPKSDGSGYKDEFDILVIDSMLGRGGSIDDLSGGEKTIIAEAVSLAISLLNRQMSDIVWQTLWRDETSSAVDDERAPLYVTMLRRALEAGGFKKLFFVSHQERATDAADARVVVDDGRIYV